MLNKNNKQLILELFHFSIYYIGGEHANHYITDVVVRTTETTF
jgi:hypothetical protein